MAKKVADNIVYIISKESTCGECGDTLAKGAWVFLAGDRKAFCLSCAEFDHLEFLPSGDACVSRRAKKYSTLTALVMKWAKRRRRYERQGILAEEAAIEKAEEECLEDYDVRKKRNERASVKREELDQEYVKEFAEQIRKYFPKLPRGRERKIAEHACRKYSGRVGRTAKAKGFNREMIQLAVIAHIRHHETDYDSLLAKGEPKKIARASIQPTVEKLLERWGETVVNG